MIFNGKRKNKKDIWRNPEGSSLFDATFTSALPKPSKQSQNYVRNVNDNHIEIVLYTELSGS